MHSFRSSRNIPIPISVIIFTIVIFELLIAPSIFSIVISIVTSDEITVIHKNYVEI